jgi:hypothetical protein
MTSRWRAWCDQPLVIAEKSAANIHSDTNPAVAKPKVTGLLQSGLAALQNWLVQLAANAACVAAIKDTTVAPPHTIAKNKIRFFTMCSHCRAGGSTTGLSATGA